MSPRLIAATLGLVLHASVMASPSTDMLGKCFSDYTSGKDRKDLAKWIFVAMSAHPELGPIAKASAEDVEAVQKSMGALFTRLVSENCPTEMGAVVKADGTEGIKSGFEQLGRIAMQELLANQQVTATIGGFERFIDSAKVDPIFKPK